MFAEKYRSLHVLLLISLSIAFIKCTNEIASPTKDYKINLRWIKSYPDQTVDNVRTGFIWSMNFLGAHLPASKIEKAIIISGTAILEIDISQLGFNDQALEAMMLICNRIKESGEYQSTGAIDIGRFLMLTVYSSHHYYRITGAPENLSAFLAKYNFQQKNVFAVTNSAIAFGNRKINFESSTSINSNNCFIAEEGTGSIVDSTFITKEFETVNLMDNGQLRYLIFDHDGNLATNADPNFSASGKPGKCMWCHESRIQPLFSTNTDVPGYSTSTEFLNKVNTSNQLLTHLRMQYPSGLNWLQPEDHTLSELLYISFMEPSLERIAGEWGIDIATTSQILSGLPQHTHDEFPFLGNLYHRSSVDSLAPYHVERVPLSAREHSVYEPDFF